jgi:anti-sigma-K factor RskA
VSGASAAAVTAVAAAALAVAAGIARPRPDFATAPVVAVLRDAAAQPAWAIRFAGAARELAAQALRPEIPPSGRAYQLWLWPEGGAAPRSLGLLPRSAAAPMPLTPATAQLLCRTGRLTVTLAPPGGGAAPRGPAIFAGRLDAAVKKL